VSLLVSISLKEKEEKVDNKNKYADQGDVIFLGLILEFDTIVLFSLM
jgi:hypothetical protein